MLYENNVYEIFRNSTKDLEGARGGVFALGNFDGVHLGHQALLKETIKLADEKNVLSGVMTFNPNPKKFFQPRNIFFNLLIASKKLK